jgi:arabinose-5-phosphate isomerase
MDYLARAREVIEAEVEGLTYVAANLGEEFLELVEICLKTIRENRKLVLCGVGKNAHVGSKIAATLSSIGAPAVFLHPVEAMHGDLGVLSDGDALLALSYSGETDELLAVLPACRRFELPIIAITGNTESQLAEWADLVVPMPVPKEACPFNLAPTVSTTALLALGDALALVLLDARGFRQEDYGKLHPAGAIGRSVTLRVRDVMRSPEQTARVHCEDPVRDSLLTMTKCRAGSVLVVDDDDKLLGIFTDGDLRRHILEDPGVLDKTIESVMTCNPITVSPDQMAVDILNILDRRQIDDIPVVDEDGLAVGIVDVQDLPKFKVVVSTAE